MPGLFHLGLYQKGFGGNNIVNTPSIKLGCTRGRASSTRMFNYCNNKNNNGTCLYNFITVQGVNTRSSNKYINVPSF
jgi:hypothetical protein